MGECPEGKSRVRLVRPIHRMKIMALAGSITVFRIMQSERTNLRNQRALAISLEIMQRNLAQS